MVYLDRRIEEFVKRIIGHAPYDSFKRRGKGGKNRREILLFDLI